MPVKLCTFEYITNCECFLGLEIFCKFNKHSTLPEFLNVHLDFVMWTVKLS